MNKFKIVAGFATALGLSILLALFPAKVEAGVGVSPATIENTRLLAGNVYTTDIVFSRSDANEAIVIEIEPELGVVNDWVTFNPGSSFTLDAGIQRTTIKMQVAVPAGQTLRPLEGSVRLKVTPVQSSGATVEVVKGAKINVLLATTNSTFVDFLVRSISVSDIDNQGVGKLMVKVENIGNVAAAPTRANFNILNLDEEALTSFDVSGFEDIQPGEVSDQMLNFAIRGLTEGEYFADITVFDGSEVLREERVVINVPIDTTSDDSISVSDATGQDEFSRFLEENRLISLLLVVLIATAATALIIFLFRNSDDEKEKKTAKS